jgi:hypothetical protein
MRYASNNLKRTALFLFILITLMSGVALSDFLWVRAKASTSGIKPKPPMLAAMQSPAASQTIILYQNNFEAPNVPLQANCATLDARGINSLYGTSQGTFEQVNTVEGVLLKSPQYSDPSGIGGNYAIGMLANVQDDMLALTFDTQGKAYLNVAMDISGLDVPGCGGPFGVAAPQYRLTLVNSPNGVFNFPVSSGTILSQQDVTGIAPPNQYTTNWSHQVVSLSTTGATDGKVTLVWDLRQSGYAVFDNLIVAASDTAGDVGPTPTSCSSATTLGLVGYWPGDGNANDIVGHNNGTASASVSYEAAEAAQGFRFNPSAPTTSLVHVPNATILQPAGVTVDVWVKATAPGAYKYILSKSDDYCSASYGLYTGGAGGLQFYVKTSPGCSGSLGLSPDAGSIWDGNFHHVVGSYDGNFVRLYVDGVQIGNGTATSGPIQYDSTFQNGDLLIGNFVLDPGTYFAWPGVIDEVGVYNRALSASEIQSVFNAGNAGQCNVALPTPTPTPTPIPTPACNSVETFYSGAPLQRPVDLAFAANGDLYVSDIGAAADCSTQDGKVVVISPNRSTRTAIAGNQLQDPFGIALGTGGTWGTDLYIADENSFSCNGGVFRVNASGGISTLASGSPFAGDIGDPNGLAFGPGGAFGTELYVADYSTQGGGTGNGGSGVIYRVDSTGTRVPFVYGAPLIDPANLAFGPGGAFGNNLYVADFGDIGGTGYIWTVDPSGHITQFAGGGGAPFVDPVKIAFGPGGCFGTDLYVLDSGAHKIFRVDSSGNISTYLDGITQWGYLGGLAFNGDTLYFTRNTEIDRIRCCASPPPTPTPTPVPTITGGLPPDGGILGPGDPTNPGHVSTTVTGTGQPGCTIQLTVTDPHETGGNNNRTLSTTVDAAGNWAIPLTLDDCDPVIDIVEVCGGAPGTPVHRHIYVDGTPPRFTNGGPADGTTFVGGGGTATIILDGSASDPNTYHCVGTCGGGLSYQWVLIGGGAGGIDLVLGGGGAAGTLTGGGSGLSIDLPPGDYDIEVTVTDAAGNRLVKHCHRHVCQPLTITGGLPGDGGIYGPGDGGTPGKVTRVVKGTGNPGCRVQVAVTDTHHPQLADNNKTYTVPVDNSGHWALPLTLDDCDPVVTVTEVCDGVSDGGDIIRQHVYVDGTPPTVGLADGSIYAGTDGLGGISLDAAASDADSEVPGDALGYKWYSIGGDGTRTPLCTANCPAVFNLSKGVGAYDFEVVVTDRAGNQVNKRCQRIVQKRPTSLTCPGANVPYGTMVTLTGTLVDTLLANNPALATKPLTFKVSGQPVPATFEAWLPPGTYTVGTSFAGDDLYQASTCNCALTVQTTPGKITGGGSIDQSVRNFGFVVQTRSAGGGSLSFTGSLEFQDKAKGINLHATAITAIAIAPDRVHGAFAGTATVNGVSGYTFTVYLEDNGEPGAGADKFLIQISGPNGFAYNSANENIAPDTDPLRARVGILDQGGNIQVHKAN